MKRLTILSTAIILSASLAFAERGSFHNRTENWLQRESAEETSGSLRGAPTIGGQTPSDDPVPNPVGEGLLLLSVLSGVYVIRKQQG